MRIENICLYLPLQLGNILLQALHNIDKKKKDENRKWIKEKMKIKKIEKMKIEK